MEAVFHIEGDNGPGLVINHPDFINYPWRIDIVKRPDGNITVTVRAELFGGEIIKGEESGSETLILQTIMRAIAEAAHRLTRSQTARP